MARLNARWTAFGRRAQTWDHFWQGTPGLDVIEEVVPVQPPIGVGAALIDSRTRRNETVEERDEQAEERNEQAKRRDEAAVPEIARPIPREFPSEIAARERDEAIARARQTATEQARREALESARIAARLAAPFDVGLLPGAGADQAALELGALDHAAIQQAALDLAFAQRTQRMRVLLALLLAEA